MRRHFAPNRVARLFNRFWADSPNLAADLEFDPDAVPYVDFERIVVSWLLKAQAPE